MAYAPRVLIVEDEDPVRRLFEQILSEDGYYVTAVATGRHALQVVRDTTFDVAIVDMGLPDGDGPDLVRNIVSEFPHIHAVALSGEMGTGMSRLARQAGAVWTAQKPITPQELRNAIYGLLDESCGYRAAS